MDSFVSFDFWPLISAFNDFFIVLVRFILELYHNIVYTQVK